MMVGTARALVKPDKEPGDLQLAEGIWKQVSEVVRVLR